MGGRFHVRQSSPSEVRYPVRASVPRSRHRGAPGGRLAGLRSADYHRFTGGGSARAERVGVEPTGLLRRNRLATGLLTIRILSKSVPPGSRTPSAHLGNGRSSAVQDLKDAGQPLASHPGWASPGYLIRSQAPSRALAVRCASRAERGIRTRCLRLTMAAHFPMCLIGVASLPGVEPGSQGSEPRRLSVAKDVAPLQGVEPR